MAIPVTLVFAFLSTFGAWESDRDLSDLDYYRSQAAHFDIIHKNPIFTDPESSNENALCKQNGKFPYPGNCKKYIECWGGHGTIKSCPFELYFDKDLGCTIKSLVNCKESNDDFTCLEDHGLFQYPPDCHKYYECNDEKAYLKTCLGGLEFDNKFGCILKSSTCVYS